MSDRDLNTAIKLMDRAWIRRGEAILSPPESKEELDQIVSNVRNDLVESVAICREVGALTELVNALRRLGHVEQDTGHEDKTFALYQEAVDVSRRCDDALLEAHTVRHLGDIYRNMGRNDEAVDCYQQALQLYRGYDQPPTLDYANAVRPMAIALETLGEIDQAKQHWEIARDLYQVVGITEGVDECNHHLTSLG